MKAYKKVRSCNEHNILTEEYINIKNKLRIAFTNNRKKLYAFTICFFTPCYDNSGITHILEHCIVKGMETSMYKNKYVYFNAETFIDRTVFEFQVEDYDFYIKYIKEVLYKIFNPPFYTDKNIFLTEGWHIKKDENGYSYVGVVYNEMKNILSKPINVLLKKIPQSLFRYSSYDKVSGGIPQEILNVTLNKIIEYHKTYYRPNNCYISICGDIDLSIVLEEIDDILNEIEISDDIKLESFLGKKAFEYCKEYYNTLNSKGNKSYISNNYEVEKPKNLEEYLIDKFLVNELVHQYNQNTFMKNNFEAIYCLYNNSTYRTYFSIILEGYKEIDKETFKDISKEILNGIVNDEEIEKKIIHYLKNNSLKEKLNKRNLPDNILVNTLVMESWMYYKNPFSYLDYSYDDNNIKRYNNQGLKNIAEDILKRIKKNTILELLPKLSIKKEEKVLKERIIEENMLRTSEQKCKEINFEIDSSMLDYSQKVNKLYEKVKDLKQSEKYINGVNVFLYENIEDQLTYINLYFNLGCLEEELLYYVSVLQVMLMLCLSENMKINPIYKKAMDKGVCLKIQLEIIQENSDCNKVHPKLIIRGSITKKNENLLLEVINLLIKEIKSKFSNNEIKEIMKMMLDKFERTLDNNVGILSVRRAVSNISLKCRYEDIFHGISMCKFLHKSIKCFDENIMNNITKVIDIVYNKKNLIISVYEDNINKKRIEQEIGNFLDKLKYGQVSKAVNEIKLIKKNEAFITNTNGNYVAKTYSLENIDYHLKDKIAVLCEYLNTKYLFDNCRKNIGAYESYVKEVDGCTMVFFLYHNDTFIEFMNVIKDSVQSMKQYKYDRNAMNLLKYNEIQKKLSINNSICKNDIMTINYIKKMSIMDIELSIKHILNISEEDIFKFIKLLENNKFEEYICMISNEKNVKKDINNFNTVSVI